MSVLEATARIDTQRPRQIPQAGCERAEACRRRRRRSPIRAIRSRSKAWLEAAKLKLIEPILVGPEQRIRAVAAEHGLDISGFEIVDAEYSQDSAAKAVALVREGRAEALMKGSLHTDELMSAVVARDTGLRTSRRISHCFIMDVPGPRPAADHHRCRGQHRAGPEDQGRHHAERDRPRPRARASRRCGSRS